MMRLVFLGNSAAVPSPASGTSCFALKQRGTFLFDCAEGAQRQMMKYKISYAKVQAIFVSHLHADHFLGIFGLLQTMGLQGRTEELLIFGPAGTKKLLETVFSFNSLNPGFPVKITEISRKGLIYEDKLIKVTAFPVEHSGKCFGFTIDEQPIHKFHEELARSKGIKGRLFTEIQEKGFVLVDKKKVKLEDVTFLKPGKKIVYTGDTMYSKNVEKEAEGADLLIHDSTFSEKERETADEKHHATVLDAANTAKKAGAKQLAITHISNRYGDQEALLKEAKATFPNSILAKPGLELLI